MSLALMALVAAVSSGGRSPLPSRPYPVTLARPHHPPTVRADPPATTSTTESAVPATRTQTEMVALGRSSSAVGTIAAVGTVTTTTTATMVTDGSGVGTTPVQPADRTTDQGYLQPPDNSTALYTFNADGPTQVTVSWAPATTLSLTVACPSGTQTGEGTSSVTVTAPDTAGSCQATLTEPVSGPVTVSYTLVIGPATGG